MPRQPAARPGPPVTPPVQPVAISAAKPAVPQGVAPKRRRSFTGEPRPSEKARPAAAPAAGSPAQPKRRRTHTGDDLHLRPRAPEPPPTTRVADPPSIWDDLDEDTRVISAKGRGHDEIDQALERLRAAPPPAAPYAAAQPAPAALYTATPAPAARAERGTDSQNPFAQSEPTQVMARKSIHEEPTTDGAANGPPSAITRPNVAPYPASAEAAAGSPATERPPSQADGALPAPKRLDTLPALRVAVLGTGIAGEVRLISLDAGDEPPPGAALAVLVPLSGADGEAVARLFGAIE